MDLTNLRIQDLTECGKEIKAQVLQRTGIPVSVGIATSKTLTKIASEIVKKNPEYGGVLDLSCLSDELIDEYLSKVEIGDVWGIGPQYTKFLTGYGITTAKDLKNTNEHFIRKHLTVVGNRTVLELRGISCNPIALDSEPKKVSDDQRHSGGMLLVFQMWRRQLPPIRPEPQRSYGGRRALHRI